jgi:hypothetical protein
MSDVEIVNLMAVVLGSIFSIVISVLYTDHKINGGNSHENYSN